MKKPTYDELDSELRAVGSWLWCLPRNYKDSNGVSRDEMLQFIGECLHPESWKQK